MTFSELLNSIGKTDKNTAHTYGPWYDLWFQNLRDVQLNIMEVGVCVFGGGSVLALAEYFPLSTVWALDIDATPCVSDIFSHPRIRFIEGDAYNPEILKHFEDTRFDIIIDDASHEVADQLKLLTMLRPYLKDDGFYVVEDCCTGHWLPRMPEIWKLGLEQTIIDMSTATVYDNTLIRLDAK